MNARGRPKVAPTKEKVMPLKIPQTAVGEGLAPPAENHHQPKPNRLSKSNDFYDSVGVGAHDDPCKTPPTESNRSVEMLQRMVRVVEAPTPTDVKGKTEEILLTIVVEDIILPPKTTAHRKKKASKPLGSYPKGQFCKNTVYFARDIPYSCFLVLMRIYGFLPSFHGVRSHRECR